MVEGSIENDPQDPKAYAIWFGDMQISQGELLISQTHIEEHEAIRIAQDGWQIAIDEARLYENWEPLKQRLLNTANACLLSGDNSLENWGIEILQYANQLPVSIEE